MKFEVKSPETVVTSRNRNRSVFASAGAFGGRCGALAHFTTIRGTEWFEHGNTDVIHCQPGDIIEVQGPGAGGFGLPAERDPAAVLHDVRCGFVSVSSARDSYGVVIHSDKVQEEATLLLRAEMLRQVTRHFDFGESRRRYEAVWTPFRYELLTSFLAESPTTWRHFLKKQVFAEVQRNEGSEEDIRQTMERIFINLRERFAIEKS